MAQVVPAEVGYPGSLEDLFPRRLKSGGDIKDTRSGSGLLAPAPQHAHGFVIERNMPGLAILGIPALDGEEPTAEVDGTPTQLDHLAAPQSRIHREQYGRRQVIAKVRERRQHRLVPCLPPVIATCTMILHFKIALHQGIPPPRFFGLIQKAHLASAINARLIDAPHRIFGQLAGFDCASEYAREREEIAQDS